MAKSVTSGVAYPRDTNALAADLADMEEDGGTPVSARFVTRSVSDPWLRGANWTQYGSGTGTVTESTDSVHGKTLQFAATVAGAKYSIGMDFFRRTTKPLGFSFWVKKDATASIMDLELGYAQSGFTKYIRFQKNFNWADTGVWVQCFASPAERDYGNATASEMLDLRAIRISITPTAGNTSTLEIADIRMYEVDRPGQIGFFFDDGRADTYSVAYPLLSAKGFPFTVAPEYETVGNAGRCTLAQLQTMYNTGLCDFAGHTAATNFRDTSAATQIAAHKAIKAFLVDNNFLRAAHIMAWFGGARDDEADQIGKQYWSVTRAVNSFGICGVQNACNPIRPPVRYMLNTVSLATAKANVDNIKNYGGTMVFVFHSLVDSVVESEDWLTTNFSDLLDYIQAQGVEVVPVRNIWVNRDAKIMSDNVIDHY